jgi:hypothetical protein
MTKLPMGRTIAAALAVAWLASAGGCPSGSSGSAGKLWIEIVSPSSTGSHTASSTTVSVGGNVGGWTIFDPAPTISWRNDANGASGADGQLLGTFSTAQIPLELGGNTIHVKAANGVQEKGTDVIVVTRTP